MGKILRLRLFKQYPSGFDNLFLTQAFFNFSFYGIKSLFLLYVMAQFSLSQKDAIGFFALFMAVAYANCIVGGMIADKSLGVKNTTIIGGFLHVTGAACLLVGSEAWFFLGLSLVSLGSGLFKPNLSTTVGLLFDNPQDPRKDKIFSTLYIAMNLGGFAAPLVCGLIAKNWGWKQAFLLIALMFLIAICLFYRRINANPALKHRKELSSFEGNILSNPVLMTIFLVAIVYLQYLLFEHRSSFNHLMGIVALVSLAYLGKIVCQCNRQERRDVFSIIVYIICFALFCSLFEQAGSSLMLFYEHAVNRHIMNFVIPASSFMSLGPVFVLILSPLIVLFWEKILERNKRMNGLTKIGIGFLWVSASFWILALSTCGNKTLVSPFWIAGAIFLQTIGELWIVPIGFSNVSKFSPPRFRSLMMSFWLMAIAYGHYFAGFIAYLSLSETPSSMMSSLSASSELTSPVDLAHYGAFFFNLSLLPFALAVGLLLYVGMKRCQNRLGIKRGVSALS
ncbi:MAG: peptide MFS transporter [Caedimonas sp.]|nr:peptide MFS transporter [Caedimonas sp.]